jgi:energy-coupling factor transport system ATP-binding protein
MGQSILLLDEPLAYLDARGTEFLLQLLKSRVQQGQSVFLIEHRLDLVREICDRAYHFQDGKLVEGFPPQELWRGEAVPKLSPPDPDAPVVLRSQNLSWGGYPPFPNLEVRAGETVLLKGENGCGKTTLLRLLSGLLKPATGSLQVFGRDTRNKSVIQMAHHIGFVLQNPNHQLFADSVRAEVLQPSVTPEDGDALLEKLNLCDRAEQHPQSLSQGQKRRLALGAVLARQPKICLLDEITVGQDPRSLILMLKVLGEFTEGGGTLILTSHDPKVADYLSARIVNIPSNF